jgi:hypothetical protein
MRGGAWVQYLELEQTKTRTEDVKPIVVQIAACGEQ